MRSFICVICAALTASTVTVFVLSVAVQAEETHAEGEAALRAGQFGEAVKEITAAIERGYLDNEEIANALARRAYAYQELQRMQLSRYDLDRAIKIKPYDSWLYSRRCWANAQLDNLLSAKRDCDTATWLLQKEKSHADYNQEIAAIHNARAEIFFRKADYKSAIREYGIAIEKKESSVFFENRGNVKALVGDFRGAVKDYTSALSLADKTSHLYGTIAWKRGSAWYRLNSLDSAALDFSKAVLIQPENAEFLNDHCWVYALIDRPEEAINSCNNAVSIEPENEVYWDSQAFAYYKMGEYKMALHSVDMALSISPNFKWPIYHKILIKIKSDEYSSVSESVKKLHRIDPDWDVAQRLYEDYIK